MAKRITVFIITLVVFCMTTSMLAFAGGNDYQLPILPINKQNGTGSSTDITIPDGVQDVISDVTSGDVKIPDDVKDSVQDAISDITSGKDGTDSGFVTPPVDIVDTTETGKTVTETTTTTDKTASSKTDASSYTVTLSKTKYTYNGKAKKPTVTVKNKKGTKLSDKYYTVKYSNNKKVGTATVKITYKGKYKGSSKKTFKIVPKSTSLKKLTAKSKSFKATWKKQTTQTTGYQLQYSTSSKFAKKSTKTVTVKKNSTASKTVKKLKGKKKYYVRIRTYKTVDGKKYYSSWSKVLNVTTKK